MLQIFTLQIIHNKTKNNVKCLMWKKFRHVYFLLERATNEKNKWEALKSSVVLLQFSKWARALECIWYVSPLFEGELLKQRTMTFRKDERKRKIFQTTSILCVVGPLSVVSFPHSCCYSVKFYCPYNKLYKAPLERAFWQKQGSSPLATLLGISLQ